MPTKHKQSLIDTIRVTRQARADQRALKRELAAYTSVGEIDDMLAILGRDESLESDQMRSVLLAQRTHAVQLTHGLR